VDTTTPHVCVCRCTSRRGLALPLPNQSRQSISAQPPCLNSVTYRVARSVRQLPVPRVEGRMRLLGLMVWFVLVTFVVRSEQVFTEASLRCASVKQGLRSHWHEHDEAMEMERLHLGRQRRRPVPWTGLSAVALFGAGRT